MSDDGRIIRLETEMGHVRCDVQRLTVSVDNVKTALHAFREDIAQEFGFVRTEMARELDSVRTDMAKELGSLRAGMEKSLGSTQADIEKLSGSLRTEMATQFGSLKTSLERYMRWLITAGLGMVATLLAMFATVAHALKWF
jgi:hypothetical protein